MAGYENRQEQAQGRAEVTIKFGRGLMSEPFTSKNGKELVEIKIPNADHSDSRPWESFVVPSLLMTVCWHPSRRMKPDLLRSR